MILKLLASHGMGRFCQYAVQAPAPHIQTSLKCVIRVQYPASRLFSWMGQVGKSKWMNMT
jgi:hypothetical protein